MYSCIEDGHQRAENRGWGVAGHWYSHSVHMKALGSTPASEVGGEPEVQDQAYSSDGSNTEQTEGSHDGIMKEMQEGGGWGRDRDTLRNTCGFSKGPGFQRSIHAGWLTATSNLSSKSLLSPHCPLRQQNNTFSVASAQEGLTAGRTFAVVNLVATVATKIQKEFWEGPAKERPRLAVRGAEGRVPAGWGLTLAAREGDSATDLLNKFKSGV